MSQDDPSKISPFQLNRSRIVLLVLGALLLTIIISSAMGGLNNYQHLKEAAQEAKLKQQAPAETPPAN
jgi:hypothetical protein